MFDWMASTNDDSRPCAGDMEFFTILHRQIDEWVEPTCDETELDTWKRTHHTALGLEAFERALYYDLWSEFILTDEQTAGVHAIIAILVTQLKEDLAVVTKQAA